MSLHHNLLQVPLQKATTLYNNEIVPRLTKKNNVVAISVAVAVTLVYMIRDRFFKPPKNVRHIPYIGYYSVIRSLMKGETLFDRGYRVILPRINAVESKGLYLEPGRSGWEIHISNPEDAKRILLKHEIFPKIENITEGNSDTLLSKFIVGRNILFLNGHEWKSQRQVANPAFRRSMPVRLFGKLTQELFHSVENMESETIEATDLMERWSLEAIGKAGFGFDFNAMSDLNSPWVNIYNHINEGLRNRLFFLFPVLDQQLRWLFQKRVQVHKELDTFFAMLDEVIQKKRNLVKQGQVQNNDLEEHERDLLTLMIESENRGEGAMSDTELKSNLCLFFFAGHETTANALSFALYYLAKNPDIQQRAREEAINILGDENEDVLPTVEDTKQMKYINQIMKETLRLNGPAPRTVARRVTEDTVLPSGTFVPKGSLVAVNIFNVHHSAKVWKNSNQFDPDRFAEDGEVKREAGEGMTWLPFGNGARQCLGMNFSLNEQRVMLSMLLRKYVLILPEDSIHRDAVLVTGFPNVGPKMLDIIFRKRY